MKFNKTRGSILVIATLALTVTLQINKSPESSHTKVSDSGESFYNQSRKPNSSLILGATSLRADEVASSVTKNAANNYHIAYFKVLATNRPEVKRTYKRLKELLPSGRTSELVSMYISSGGVAEDSPSFNYFLKALQDELDDRGDDVYREFVAREQLLKKDPFVYQMVINQVRALNISPDKKAYLFGRALDENFEFDSEGHPTWQSGNITTAFMQMKNSGISASLAQDAIARGIARNQNDPRAFAEFNARAKAFYPELFEQ